MQSLEPGKYYERIALLNVIVIVPLVFSIILFLVGEGDGIEVRRGILKRNFVNEQYKDM